MQQCWIIFGVVTIFTTSIYAHKPIVCYMAAWSVGRPDLGKFSVLDADVDHCTHIVYAFMGLNESTNEIKSIEPYIDLDQQGLGQNQLIKLKQLKFVSPGIKLLASIGGWNEGGKKFSVMASSPEKRQAFIKSVKYFISRYDLDGIDICWQFPGTRGGSPQDKENAIILFKELKNAFEWESWILTVHIIGKRYVMDAYDLKAVSDVVDYINLVPVEFNGPWERTTGAMAPLTSKDELNVQFAVDYMLKKGVARDKLLLGLPTYGHAYVLPEPINGQYVGLFSNETFASQWTMENGVIGYNEVCYNMKHSEGWQEVWDEDSQTPFVYNGNKLISYDNKRSLLLKADLVNTRMLGGVTIWSLDMDDFHGLCHGVNNYLVTAIANYINVGDLEGSSSVNTEPFSETNAITTSNPRPDILLEKIAGITAEHKPDPVNTEIVSSTPIPTTEGTDGGSLLDDLKRNNKLSAVLQRDVPDQGSHADKKYSAHQMAILFLLSSFCIYLFN